MSWEANKTGLLKMMQVNHKMFGDEILEIESVSESYLIRYFERALVNMIRNGSGWDIVVNSEYFNTTFSNGEPENISLRKEGFGLTIKQCVDIFDYIYGRSYNNDYVKYRVLHWFDVKVVLNYIKYGYELSDCYNSYALYHLPTKEIFKR